MTATHEILNRFKEFLGTLPIDDTTRLSLETLLLQGITTDPPSATASYVEDLDSVDDTVSAIPSQPDDTQPPTDSSYQAPSLPERYWHLGFIGRGSMGEVHRVYDRLLRRILALKVIRADLKHPEQAVVRFMEEAQINAQLAHPGIVPVHDLGQFPDGRWFFTAKEARGRPFTAIIEEVHEQRLRSGVLAATETGWSFRRMVDAFLKLCEAVAYAHSRGVVHRDLKPDNVLVGDFGEVMVIDWGLARPVPTPRTRSKKPPGSQVSPRTILLGPLATDKGAIAGTPAFMSPEQARGEHRALTPASDVYALGGILYMILFGDHPYRGLSAAEALERVRRGPPQFHDAPWIPATLLTICRKSLAADPGDRFADASLLAAEIEDWLEGARARERAREMVESAKRRIQTLKKQHRMALRKRERVARAVARLRSTDPLELKERCWQDEETAISDLVNMEDAFQDVAEQLRAALEHSPDLPEARAALADLYLHRHDTAIAFGDRVLARSFERLVQEYDIGHHTNLLNRKGVFSLVTDPPGAQVQILRHDMRARRLVRTSCEVMGPTPLMDVSLSTGSYLLIIRLPGYIPVHYPIHIERDHTWRSNAPGEHTPAAIPLPLANRVPKGMVYIPRGWTVLGGDPESSGGLPHQRLWVEGFFIGRFPVTNAEYLRFINSLVREGRGSEANSRLPGVPDRPGGPVQPLYVRDQAGLFHLPRQGTMAAALGDSPVSGVSWHDAAAYCLWLQKQTGVPYRLVGEAEREKATRGVDGRAFPWGQYSDPSFHCTRKSVLYHPGSPGIAEFPIDSSPYDVRGLAGGVADWCAEIMMQRGLHHHGAWADLPPELKVSDTTARTGIVRRIVKGGAFDLSVRRARAASRTSMKSTTRKSSVGFRLALSAKHVLGGS